MIVSTRLARSLSANGGVLACTLAMKSTPPLEKEQPTLSHTRPGGAAAAAARFPIQYIGDTHPWFMVQSGWSPYFSPSEYQPLV